MKPKQLTTTTLTCKAKPTSFSTPSPREKKQLLIEHNNTHNDFPYNKNLLQLFQRTAKQYPQKTAILSETTQLNYEELNHAANYVANLILEHELASESLIAICCERSPLAIILMLGVLKAGCAFLPIDPDYPKQRIDYLLTDSQTALLLTDRNIPSSLNTQLISHIQFSKKLIRSHIIQASQLAYVIYTSGSTGSPKGVMIKHQGVVNTLFAKNQQLNISHSSRLLCFSAFGFDAMIWEIFSALLAGATLLITSKPSIVPGETLADTIDSYQITHATLPPSALANLAKKTLPSLRYLTVAGEPCPLTLMQEWASKVKFFNAYGPTEATICATMGRCFSADTNVSIGKPILNTQVYVLDERQQPVTIGLTGELYISGIGLAKGYLHRPGLTAKKFIDHPFITGEKLYRTGDYARWLPDGRLEYIGRIDEQIKLRGFRIETGEIETHALKFPYIKQCAVVAKKINMRQYLLCYLTVSASPHQLDLTALKQHLLAHLPTHMIPSGFIILEQLPLTPHKKIDKRLLSNTDNDRLHVLLNHPYHKPISPHEEGICNIFASLLSLPSHRISRDVSFFDLGGDSLTAIKMIANINEQFQQEFTAQTALTHQTCEQLAKLINVDRSSNIVNIVAEKNSVLIPLRTQGDRTPIFLIHPIGGTIFMYQALLKYLPTDQPLYAIQDPAVNNLENAEFDSISAISEYYLTLIKQAQPTGPYIIGGLSSGANIACEIAERLATPTYKNIVLAFDGWAEYPQPLKEYTSFSNIISDIYDRISDKLREFHINNAEHWLKICWMRAQLMKQYYPKTFVSQVFLFKAKELLPIFQTDNADDNHWRAHCSTDLTIFNSPGNHESIFYEPNVKTLAKQIQQAVSTLVTPHDRA